MIDPDELMDELEEHEELSKQLLKRNREQLRDINEMQEELDALEASIRTSEAEEDNASGVAQ
jgi:hypothetical protein